VLDREEASMLSAVSHTPGTTSHAESQRPLVDQRKPKLLDRLRDALRSRHSSRRTEQTYCHRVKRFIFFHNVRHPAEMAEPEITAFLGHLAVKERVSASTQTQALSALLFLYRHVLRREVGTLEGLIRARKPKRLPVVMSREEVKAVLDHLGGDKRLMASVMYGAGLRLLECLRPRIRSPCGTGKKGGKDRVTMLPESIKVDESIVQKAVKAAVRRQFKHLANLGRVTVPGKPSDDLAPGMLKTVS
jgi:site-specific recombinase XerD